ncbi:hypothetical protein Cgig2_021365 [Carnegiea gigantea]|uniref:Cytochrome P450 n=1 Tax=Carnegiea gigantea TaxID=171969 RepID=A0A9Q1QGT8_9CARY|nr:hypothetical protein Cgig2_021365 [Carnegiea gigantea]
MKKAQDEIREVLKLEGKEIVDETNLHDLKYLKQSLGNQWSDVKFRVMKYHLKLEFLSTHGQLEETPKYWTELESFYPERFENSIVDYRGNHFELIPFGAGRRMCPGLGQGLINVELSLATLHYHFDWKLPREVRSKDLNMYESIGTTARRKHDLLMIPSIHPCSPLKRM